MQIKERGKMEPGRQAMSDSCKIESVLTNCILIFSHIHTVAEDHHVAQHQIPPHIAERQ